MTKTFWAGIVAIIASLAAKLWGVDIDDAAQQTLVTTCQSVAEGVGVALAVWGARKSVKAASADEK